MSVGTERVVGTVHSDNVGLGPVVDVEHTDAVGLYVVGEIGCMDGVESVLDGGTYSDRYNPVDVHVQFSLRCRSDEWHVLWEHRLFHGAGIVDAGHVDGAVGTDAVDAEMAECDVPASKHGCLAVRCNRRMLVG